MRTPVRSDELASVTAGYRLWPAKQPLSVNTRRPTWDGHAVLRPPRNANDYGSPLSDPHARNYAIRVQNSSQELAQGQAPSVNLMLADLDHLYMFLGLGRPKVRREHLPQEAAQGVGVAYPSARSDADRYIRYRQRQSNQRTGRR